MDFGDVDEHESPQIYSTLWASVLGGRLEWSNELIGLVPPADCPDVCYKLWGLFMLCTCWESPSTYAVWGWTLRVE